MIEGARERGVVKWFNSKKGFGFATRGNGSKDVFVHINNLPAGVEDLKEGQALTFLTEETRKGVRATNIQIED